MKRSQSLAGGLGAGLHARGFLQNDRTGRGARQPVAGSRPGSGTLTGEGDSVDWAHAATTWRDLKSPVFHLCAPGEMHPVSLVKSRSCTRCCLLGP